jgi:hypothetical protein
MALALALATASVLVLALDSVTAPGNRRAKGWRAMKTHSRLIVRRQAS